MSEGRVSPSVYIDTGKFRKGCTESGRKEGVPMDVLELMAVISFGLSCFGIGYSLGKDSNSAQK